MGGTYLKYRGLFVITPRASMFDNLTEQRPSGRQTMSPPVAPEPLYSSSIPDQTLTTTISRRLRNELRKSGLKNNVTLGSNF